MRWATLCCVRCRRVSRSTMDPSRSANARRSAGSKVGIDGLCPEARVRWSSCVGRLWVASGGSRGVDSTALPPERDLSAGAVRAQPRRERRRLGSKPPSGAGAPSTCDEGGDRRCERAARPNREEPDTDPDSLVGGIAIVAAERVEVEHAHPDCSDDRAAQQGQSRVAANPCGANDAFLVAANFGLPSSRRGGRLSGGARRPIRDGQRHGEREDSREAGAPSRRGAAGRPHDIRRRTRAGFRSG